MTSALGGDDGLEAGRRRDFRAEFLQMVHADPLLARLAQHSYPHLRLRSTFLISAVTLLLTLLTQNMVLAVVLGVLVLAAHAAVVHLLAVRDEHGSKVLLALLRGGCAVTIVLIVGTSLAGPGGAADRDRQTQQTLQQQPGTWPASLAPAKAGTAPLPAASMAPSVSGLSDRP